MMENFIEILFEPINEFLRGFISFLPSLLAMLFILILGVIFAWIVRLILLRILRSSISISGAIESVLRRLYEKGMYGPTLRGLRTHPFLVSDYPLPDGWIECLTAKDHRRHDITIFPLHPEGLFCPS